MPVKLPQVKFDGMQEWIACISVKKPFEEIFGRFPGEYKISLCLNRNILLTCNDVFANAVREAVCHGDKMISSFGPNRKVCLA